MMTVLASAETVIGTVRPTTARAARARTSLRMINLPILILVRADQRQLACFGSELFSEHPFRCTEGVLTRTNTFARRAPGFPVPTPEAVLSFPGSGPPSQRCREGRSSRAAHSPPQRNS